jgi:hypothetical protein
MQAINELAKWLQDACKVDPAEPCRGSTAVQTLFGRLILEYGNTAISFRGNHLLVGKDGLLVPEGIREFIWGVTQEIVTVDDEELETAPELEEPEVEELAEEPEVLETVVEDGQE